MNYPYAVFDRNQSGLETPHSVHRVLSAAKRSADRRTATGNDNWVVVEWNSDKEGSTYIQFVTPLYRGETA
jgi:hypothetical protein